MKKENKKDSGILAKIFVMLAFILAIFAGGYFFLDKIIVPKYFKTYDINGVGDLIGVVSSLYRNPKESKLIKNGYTTTDLTNAISKLQEAEYKIEDNGTIKDDNMNSFKGSKKLELTDREFASICNELLQNGLLEKSLTKLNYLNITKLSVLDFIITIDEASLNEEDDTYTKANVNFIVKVETTQLREQIAEQMDTPIYLLKMIIPDVLYFEVNYDVDLKADAYGRTNGTIAINGCSAKKSETLINLLISFIFSSEEEMDIEKFTNQIGSVAMQGVDALGNFKFIKFEKNNQNGFLINEE